MACSAILRHPWFTKGLYARLSSWHIDPCLFPVKCGGDIIAGQLILLPSLEVKQSALLFNWISTCYGLKSISKKFLTVMLITTSIIFIVIISLSDNEAARRLRFTPLLSSSKFPAFSALKCLQNSSIIQNNSVTLQSVVISNKFVICCNSLMNVQNICETTNFLWTLSYPELG